MASARGCYTCGSLSAHGDCQLSLPVSAVVWNKMRTIVVVVGVLLSCQPPPGYGAMQGACRFDCDAIRCLQTILPQDCPVGTLYQEKIALYGCCSACARYLKEGTGCDPEKQHGPPHLHTVAGVMKESAATPVVLVDQCFPGLECKYDDDAQEHICAAKDGTANYGCEEYLENYQHWLATKECKDDKSCIRWKPVCEYDGGFAPRQCKTDPGSAVDGWCYCVDKYGQRQFGLAQAKDMKEMNCACSRRVWELRGGKEGKGRKDVTLHCLPNGNFEPLQCDDHRCWCVNSTTTEVISEVVPEQLWTELPCYDAKQNGDMYLRRCESRYFAQQKIIEEALNHGLELRGLVDIACDPDGSFAAVQKENGALRCRDKFNSDYVWHVDIEQAQDVTCNCARDTKIYFPQAGHSWKPTCTDDGNYQKWQTVGDEVYCVDEDGFTTSNSVPLEQKCCLPCYPKEWACDADCTGIKL